MDLGTLTGNRRALTWVALLGLVAVAGCGTAGAPGRTPASAEGPDLAAARAGFVTKLTRRGPSPQDYGPATPPEGVEEVEYESGGLALKGWLWDPPRKDDGPLRPAVVFLHGGWAFGAGDWRDASPFAAAGFVVFTPMLRGENGNPGVFEAFYGEVDDAVAAGRFVASRPGVDPKRVFVSGHSSGALLAVMAAMVPSPYRAAAAFSAYVDVESWAHMRSQAPQVVFDPDNVQEVRLRNPMAFVASLRIPLTLYVEPAAAPICRPFANRAEQLGKDCRVVGIPGDHMSMLEPSVREAVSWFGSFGSK